VLAVGSADYHNSAGSVVFDDLHTDCAHHALLHEISWHGIKHFGFELISGRSGA
jgi:hypothetical protein